MTLSSFDPYLTLWLPARVARIFYRQTRDVNDFLRSNTSVTRTSYLRILVLASIDIMLTLPFGIVSIALDLISAEKQTPGLPFYWGWTVLHTEWAPTSVSYSEMFAGGTGPLARFYFSQWTSPVLAFAIFGLFGLTSEARASYWRAACTIAGWFGWKPTLLPSQARSRSGAAERGEGPGDDLIFNLNFELEYVQRAQVKPY